MIRVFFGSVGCGKTTCAVRSIVKEQNSHAKYCKRDNKQLFKFLHWIFPKHFYQNYFTNFDCKVSTSVSLADLGQWTLPPNSLLIVDESGIEYNNRKFKSLSQDTIRWFKLHRHYRVDVDFYSQSWEDTDITILRLATEYWHVRRLGPFTIMRKVRKFVFVDNDQKQIVDGYEFKSFWKTILPPPFHETTCQLFLRKPYYKYFDSYAIPNTPVKYSGVEG